MATGTDDLTPAAPAEPASDSLRDILDAAFDQHSTAEPPAAPAAPTPPAAPTTPPASPVAGPAPAPAGMVRDEHGRFVSAAAAPAGAPAAPATPGVTAPAPQPPELKAPSAWRPEVREKWAGVDPAVRSEIHRREQEHQRTLQQAAGARQFQEAFENVVRPYELFIRQENSNPLAAVQNLMQTAADLRVGAPQQKARVVANIVRQYGIDLQTLDTVLAEVMGGGGAPAPAGGNGQFHDPRLDQFLAQQAEQQRQQQAQFDANMAAGLRTFAETHEFYGDVSATMASLVELANRKGETVDLEKIYTKACQLDDGIANILAARAAAAAKAAAPTSQAVLRAKRAAASVKSDPSPDGATVPKNDSVRAAIEAAFDAHGTT